VGGKQKITRELQLFRILSDASGHRVGDFPPGNKTPDPKGYSKNVKTIFDFDPAIKQALQSSLEEKLKEVIDDEELRPCHGDFVQVSVVMDGHPLNVGINGDMRCSCGRILSSFHGSDDGSSLAWRSTDQSARTS
jgi:hypothetical protein